MPEIKRSHLLPQILVIDDELGWSLSKRQLFCKSLALRDVTDPTWGYGRLKAEEQLPFAECLAEVCFHPGQIEEKQKDGNWTRVNSWDDVEKMIERGWSDAAAWRWAMVLVDFQFPHSTADGPDPLTGQEFGREIVEKMAKKFPFRKTSFSYEAVSGLIDFPVFMLTSFKRNTVEMATDSLGSQGFLAKPSGDDGGLASREQLAEALFMHGLLEDGQERLVTSDGRVTPLPASKDASGNDEVCRPMIGRSLAFLRSLLAMRRISRPAHLTPNDTDFLPLLFVRGERGCGKGEMARCIRRLSRPTKPFKQSSLDGVGSDLIPSKLFGYVAGAFTGALGDTPGLIDKAEDGTLFLDEIGNFPTDVLNRLLVPLGEATFEAVGSEVSKPIKCQITFATNKDIDAKMFNGQFPQDLYDRMTGVVAIPPLRDRRQDIPILLRHFVATKSGRSLKIADDVCEWAQKHDWPGNVRELDRTVQRAVDRRRFSRTIQVWDLEQERPKIRKKSFEGSYEEVLRALASLDFDDRHKEELGGAVPRLLRALAAALRSMYNAAAARFPTKKSQSGASTIMVAPFLGVETAGELSTTAANKALKKLLDQFELQHESDTEKLINWLLMWDPNKSKKTGSTKTDGWNEEGATIELEDAIQDE